MNLTMTVLALLTGVITGGLFHSLGVPIPAPPKLPGITGIIGIYLGYKIVDTMGWTVNLLTKLGISG
ncbi:XapX domain-containing protein [Haladaptatus sp. DFWS20]|uniref:XapX domain-containing protein n=1 Tax=Haladaptatus sp. DFWS20 TaxID=3403467 RepID=UPI003EB83661